MLDLTYPETRGDLKTQGKHQTKSLATVSEQISASLVELEGENFCPYWDSNQGHRLLTRGGRKPSALPTELTGPLYM